MDRKKLLDYKFRKKLWQENIKNNDKNIKSLVDSALSKLKLDRKWKVFVIVSNFLAKKNSKMPPFDINSFSCTYLNVCSAKQGYEIVMFFNKARMSFLSKDALQPLVLHESVHVKQAVANPEKYLMSAVDDDLSEELELEAEKESSKFDEFRKQMVLEMVLYSYDNFNGWKGAEKMVNFLYKDILTIYGPGYLRDMTKEEYEAFQEARRKKDIGLFVRCFI
ncbi:MAG: hypothetical protein WC796_02665 [Candidatus Pacearchaeota archaeon]|jgi:hypothetical protein